MMRISPKYQTCNAPPQWRPRTGIFENLDYPKSKNNVKAKSNKGKKIDSNGRVPKGKPKKATPKRKKRKSKSKKAAKSSKQKKARKSSNPKKAAKSSKPKKAAKSSKPKKAAKSSKPKKARTSSKKKKAPAKKPVQKLEGKPKKVYTAAQIRARKKAEQEEKDGAS